MAAPTTDYTYIPDFYLTVTGSNVDAGNNDYTLGRQVNLERGFTITTGTLTNMTVTILGGNTDGTLVDITTDVTGAASLSSNSGYACDVPLQYKSIVIRAARSNATNAVDLAIRARR
jgi:hypothetical protein